jgi:hypothetical protein
MALARVFARVFARKSNDLFRFKICSINARGIANDSRMIRAFTGGVKAFSEGNGTGELVGGINFWQ